MARPLCATFFGTATAEDLEAERLVGTSYGSVTRLFYRGFSAMCNPSS